MRMSIDPRTLAEMATVRIALLPDLEQIANVIDRLERGPRPPDLAAAAASASSSKKNESEPPPRESEVSVHTSLGGVQTQAAEHPKELQSDEQKCAPHAWNDAAAQHFWTLARGTIDGMLGDYLARAERIRAKGDGVLVASFPARYSFFKETCEQLENRARIEEGLARAAGLEIKVEFEILPDSQPAPAPQKSRREVLREVGERPFVRKAIDLFGDETTDFRYVPAKEGQ
jgi:hypothetical protein